MSVDKKINYEIQGGVKNYKPSEMVTVPKKAKSSPKHPATELAYITKAEKDLLIKKNLHGSLKGKVNKGPGGVMSLNGGFGEKGGFQSGGNQSAAESGDSGAFGGGAENEQNARDTRSAAINAGAGQRVNPGFFDSRTTISPEEEAAAKEYRNRTQLNTETGKNELVNPYAQGAYNATRGGTFGNFISGGGILGAGIRGLGNMFGLGKKYNEPTYDLSKYSGLGVYNDTTRVPMHDYDFDTTQLGRARTLTNAGIPTQQGDYDIYGNKINEITGEITSPQGDSLGFIPGYPGGPDNNDGGITTIPRGGQGGSDEYVKLVEKFLPVSTMPEDEDLLGGFKSRFLQNRPKEEREAIEKMINEKFKYDYPSFGLEDMDGS